jgi:1,4-alpha-glucan branching enzyme
MALSDRYRPISSIEIEHPEWSKNAVLYQINTRQFTAGGTFAAAEKHLPRLKDLGVDILWLMPINEIGQKHRKGNLGSPYAVKDYYRVNPEFGTLTDLKQFVAAAHQHGMYVILDWVANHTAWDNRLVHEHAEWYARDRKSDFRPTPWWNWPDIIEFDYRHDALREYMTKAMKYWVSELDIDGFRCDLAGFVPTDFWNNIRKELDAMKPVFMLAEWESRDLHAEAFDLTYAWSWNEAVHRIAMRQTDLTILFIFYSWNEKSFPADSMRMMFVSNHDKNAWEGTKFEQFGDGLETAMVLSVVGEGMPLIYNGQEAGNCKRLEFSERDPIEWQEHRNGEIYKKLFALKKAHTALWNGRWGARMIHVPNSAPAEVVSFVRQNERDKVFAVLNFSAESRVVTFQERLFHGQYTEYFSQETMELNDSTQVELGPRGYRIYLRS